MNNIGEIEAVLHRLSQQEKWNIARWLLEDLLEAGPSQDEAGSNGSQTPPLPDYAGRRRRIFGDKVLPNMVLAARTEDRW
jgi:hypothetical protein